MEKLNGWGFYKRGDKSVWKWHIDNREPNALYGYGDDASEKTKKGPSAFETYTNLLRAVGSGKEGLDIVDEWTFKDGSKRLGGLYHKFGGKEFVRKSDGTPVYDEDLMNAAMNDDLNITGPGLLRLMVRSRERHHTVYIIDYAHPPACTLQVWNNRAGDNEYNDGGVRIFPVDYHTEWLGGEYDESVAYREMKQIVKHYSGRREKYDGIEKRESLFADIGKGENSRVNFRPVRRRRN